MIISGGVFHLHMFTLQLVRRFYYSGGVYIYKKNSNNLWNQHTKLISSNKQARGHFGWSFSMQERIVIGAHGEGAGKGNAYVYVAYGYTWIPSLFLLLVCNIPSCCKQVIGRKMVILVGQLH